MTGRKPGPGYVLTFKKNTEKQKNINLQFFPFFLPFFFIDRGLFDCTIRVSLK
ncbi:hypothetical protein LptCag_0929 [Leptospirillum ferriphilum]|uniref:Uncharacterized protein n=1 Tax=Leptospirillum ferriphilum TaxID=178606 RepID=A0A094X3E2_9BACT|nr:hypothetical protein LptCag_0929 [Leptospirillum ferriphilum]